MRASTYLFFAVVSLLIGSVAVIIAVPVLFVAGVAGFIPAGIYGSFVLAAAIGGPIFFAVAAFLSLLLREEKSP